MGRRIFRGGASAGVPLLPILALLFLAGNLCVPPRARAQESTDFISRDLRDLKDKNATVRARAADSLGNNATEQTRKAIPALVEALKDTDESVRGAAAFALGNIPGDRQVAVPALVKALQDENGSVRNYAAKSLGMIGQSPELAVPALVGALKDDRDSRYFTTDALIKFGPAARTAVPDLIVLLKGNDPYLPSYAAKVLGAIGPHAQAAAPTLARMLSATNDQDRLEAADALAKIGRNRLEAVAIPTRLLDAEDWHDRARAAGVLRDFGAVAEPRIPALTKALGERNRDDGWIGRSRFPKLRRRFARPTERGQSSRSAKPRQQWSRAQT